MTVPGRTARLLTTLNMRLIIEADLAGELTSLRTQGSVQYQTAAQDDATFKYPVPVPGDQPDTGTGEGPNVQELEALSARVDKLVDEMIIEFD